MNVDLVTSIFQVCAILFLIASIRRLILDKELKGISIWMITFFTAWGYWGIYLFWYLDQPFSMWTNVGIAVAYTVWLSTAVFYKLIERLDRN